MDTTKEQGNSQIIKQFNLLTYKWESPESTNPSSNHHHDEKSQSNIKIEEPESKGNGRN